MRALSLTNTLFLKGIMALAVFSICFLACKEDTPPAIPKSTAAKLLTFKFEKSKNATLTADVKGSIDETTKTIAVTFPTGTAVNGLKPSVTISPKASIADTATARDFSTDQKYNVTAEDGKTKAEYTVKVTVTAAPKSTAAEITSFTIGAATGAITGKAIAVVVAADADVTKLTPTIVVSPGATVSPLSGVETDFTSTVDYIVTAEDKTATATYKVTVTKQP